MSSVLKCVEIALPFVSCLNKIKRLSFLMSSHKRPYVNHPSLDFVNRNRINRGIDQIMMRNTYHLAIHSVVSLKSTFDRRLRLRETPSVLDSSTKNRYCQQCTTALTSRDL